MVDFISDAFKYFKEKLCKEQGATNFDQVMREAAKKGHIEIVKLCIDKMKEKNIYGGF